MYVALLCKFSFDFVEDAFRRGLKSSSYLMIPLAWPQLVIPIGFTLLFLMLVVVTAKAITDARRSMNVETLDEEKNK